MKKFQPSPDSEDWSALRTRFLSSLSPLTPLYQVFDALPDHSFFAKDAQFRILCANRNFHERMGFPDEGSILGKNDFELFPEYLARNFRNDDEEVLNSGRPKLKIVELFFNRQGIPDWFLTHKFPLRDRTDRVIGLMGVSVSYDRGDPLMAPNQAVGRAIAYLREHFRERVDVATLARTAHLSPRQLHRKFVEAFGTSPQGFLMKLRIQAACEALRQDGAQISEVARELGYCDQSTFTQHFSKHMGVTPFRYQRQYRLDQGQSAPPAHSRKTTGS